MPRCLVIQHVAAESPYAIDEALRAADIEFEICRVFANEGVPGDATGLTGLVVMGGPMSARSDAGFLSRRVEVALLGDALRREIPVLGVCLGAQLLAVACGSTVRPGESGPEIGWAPVDLDDACEEDALFTDLPRQLTVLHWHGETFDLPPRSIRLASNSAYANQAFRCGELAWGVQFHLEVTAEAVAAFIEAFPEDAALAPGGAHAMSTATAGALEALMGARARVLERFAALVATRADEDVLAEQGAE